ncbi:MAG: aminodeoxychorismate/anthranilate synthase component II [Mycobacteriaceae bacterium]
MRILVVDNYDSFVFNLMQYLQQLGAHVDVLRNDDPALADTSGYDGVLLSPGPGTPERAGASVELVERSLATHTPLLGVCLGHQAIAVALGATVARAPELMHGKTSTVTHDGSGVLAGLPQPFTATRYHSLTVVPQTLPAELVATAHTRSGIVMGVAHRTAPVHGVQFHPESLLTQGGHRLLANWLAVCGSPVDETRVVALQEQLAQVGA